MDSQSPTPIKDAEIEQEVLTFSEIVSELIAGKKVHKLEWEDKEFYVFINNGILSLHKPDGKNYQWVLNDGDLAGEDYIIL